MRISIFILLFFSYLPPNLCINELSILSSKSWCWTKPILNDPNFILNPRIAGLNWGYCDETSSKTNKETEYIIYVKTSSLPESEAQGTIMIALRGSDGTSKELLLTNSGFKAGSFSKIKVTTEDIGNIFSLKLIAKDKLTWRCSSIRVESSMNFWDFECDKSLKWPISMIELNAANLIEYNLSIKTSSLDGSGTIFPIYISFIGSQCKSPFKLLSNKGFGIGSIIQQTIKTIDVGYIQQITLKINGNDNWIPEEIVVRKSSENGGNQGLYEKVFKNYKNLAVEDLNPLTLTLEENSDSIINDSSQSLKTYSILDENDMKNLIKLSCYDTLKDNDNFGPIYGGEDNYVNYMSFLAECPSDCLFKPAAPTYGVGIHPEESSICSSAIVDRASSIYGGIISININKGLDLYTGGLKIFGISISPFIKSKRSFTVSKIDSVDNIEDNIRILDNEGKLSNKGRLEIRHNGIWGTICAVGLGDKTAEIACKQLGYKGGSFLNPKENESNAKNFCGQYNGLNYCGAKPTQVLFSNLDCEGNESNIIQCNREAAAFSSNGLCQGNNHQYDTLIECENIKQDDYTSFKPNTIRLIDVNGNPTQNGVGRLEILRETWGTVCDNHNTFNDKAAEISCKQMGYLDGTVFNSNQDSINDLKGGDKNNKCSNVLGNNLCGDLLDPIKISDVQCKGHEKYLKDCKNNIITLDCNHNNDIVLKCSGLGDSSGKSQNNRVTQLINPPIKKLPLSQPFTAKCDSTPKNDYFRGDPGSIYIVNCPSDCDKSNYSVYGTGIYTINSSICRSAIHSGVLTQEGGDVILVKSFGQNKYYSTNMRGVTSLEDTGGHSSFFLSQINSGHQRLVQIYESSAVNGISKYFSSFIESGNDNKPISLYLDSSIINNSKEAKAIFEWIPSSSTDKFENSFVDLTKSEGYQKLFDLKIFTYFVKIQMEKKREKINSQNFTPKQTIFSIGGCEGYSIIINSKSEIEFDIQCSTQIISSGIYVPINSQITFGIAFDSTHLIFYLNNKKILEKTVFLPIHFTSKKAVTLGKSSEYESDFFKGKIILFSVFNEALDIKRFSTIYSQGYIPPDKIKKLSLVTLDGRQCISTCFNLPVPGRNGSPEPPIEAITYEINGDQTFLPGSSLNEKYNKVDLDPFLEIKCTSTGREVFGDKIKDGTKIRVKCPSNCSIENLEQSTYIGGVFGTLIYSLDSMICYSAIHSGIFSQNSNKNNNKEEDSILVVNLLPGMNYYQGSRQFDIQSASIEKSDYSFSIELAPPVINIDCQTTLLNEQFSGTLGTKFLVKCPKNCSKFPPIVFGNGIYSGDSSICQSAIHAGNLNDRGGEVKFEISKGLKAYFSSKAFGIESKERHSFVKSIKFFSSKDTFSIKFKEDCSEKNIDKNWEIIDDIKSFNYPSKWECVPNFMKEKNKSNLSTLDLKNLLKQSKKIKSNLPLSYGSIISLRNADIVNFLFKVSFYFNNLSPVGIIFRFKDENNYYHLRINNGGINKIALIKKYEGRSYILGTSQNALTPRIWYTFTIKGLFEKFFIYQQIGGLRNNLNLISVEDNDIQRGGLGIGTDGNDEFYVGGIYVDEYNSKFETEKGGVFQNDNAYSFESLKKENNLINREKFCKKYSMNNYLNTESCKDYHVYCQLKCNEMIHMKENILNYNCYKFCINDSITKEKMKSILNNQIAHGLDKNIWSPKEGDKCDYLPDDLGEYSTWVLCTVISVNSNENDPEQKTIEIKYQIEDNEKTQKVVYPSSNLKKCGEKIQFRDDCDKKYYTFNYTSTNTLLEI
ncbi:MAG: hypothetical protein MJ252_00430 [archaeon]|nr:hypothetical protein [archaeon]